MPRRRRDSRSKSRSRSRTRYRSVSASPNRYRGKPRYRRNTSKSRSTSRSRERNTKSSDGTPSTTTKTTIKTTTTKKTAATASSSLSTPASSSSKVHLTEKNGEISCSIEETNRIRLSLGLKPLNLGKSKDDEIRERSEKVKAEQENDMKQAELLAKIEKSKNKRELHMKLQGKSLGEQLKEEEANTAGGGSASDWVKKSRTKEAMEKIKLAERMAKKLEEQDAEESRYSSNDLAGMKVSHSLAEFQEGEQVVLTLKDQKVLDDEATEELENVNMTEIDRTNQRLRREKRSKQPVYSGYDDEEFSGGAGGIGNKTKILSHYDEEEKHTPKLTLDRAGGMQQLEYSSSQTPVILPNNKVKEDLSLKNSRSIAEYYTQDEMVAFAKPKKRRKKKLRKKENVSLDDTKEQIQMENIPKEKDSLVMNVHAEKISENDEEKITENDDDDEDPDLRAALSQARRLAVLKKQKMIRQRNMNRAIEIAEAVQSTKPMENEEDQPKSSIVFSGNTDFETRLRTALEEKERAKQLALETENRRSRRFLQDQEEKESPMDVEEERKTESQDHSTPVLPDAEEEDWGQEQPFVSSSMAATLAVLQSTGDLRNREIPRQAGRANDRRNKDSSYLKDGVKIEYKDEFGRVVTQKEAFRLQSYRFHGQKPGKKKIEQRLRTLKEELRMEKMLSGEGSLATMRALERQQKVSGQAFVMLSGNLGNSVSK